MPVKKKATKKKSRKMERKLVSREKHEITHVAKKLKTSPSKVRAAQKKTRSRKGVEKLLKDK